MKQEVITFVSKEATKHVVSDSRFVQTESFCQNVHIQNADVETSRFRSEDWFVTIDDACIHASILPQHIKNLRFAFGGKAFQYLGSSFQPSTVTLHFHQCMNAIMAHP